MTTLLAPPLLRYLFRQELRLPEQDSTPAAVDL